MTTYQKLVQRIHELLPEAKLMELRTGTAVKYKGELKTLIEVSHGGRFSFQEERAFDPEFPGYYAPIFASELIKHSTLFEILGIEPTLQHVLWALSEARTGVHLIDSVGGLWAKRKPKHLEPLSCYYDLSKPLSQQKEETLEFLLNLLS